MLLIKLSKIASFVLLTSANAEAATESFVCTFYDEQRKIEILNGPFVVHGDKLIGPERDFEGGRQQYKIVRNNAATLFAIREDGHRSSKVIYILIEKQTGDAEIGALQPSSDAQEMDLGSCKRS